MDSRDIVMLGAGRVATHLARHLHLAGHRILMVWSRTSEKAEKLARELNAQAGTRREELPAGADFYIMAVPDREIPLLAEQFSGRGGTWLHTAGAVGVEPLEEHFTRFGVLYPLQTFSLDRDVDFSELPILVEGSRREVTAGIRTLAESLSRRVEERGSEDRLLIHLAAVFANNFSNHMILIAESLLKDRGLDPELLHPLLEETIGKIKETGAEKAQTGPAMRGDVSTMDRHRELLKDAPDMEKLYTFISREITRTRE